MDEMKCRLIGGRAGIPDLHGVTLFSEERCFDLSVGRP